MTGAFPISSVLLAPVLAEGLSLSAGIAFALGALIVGVAAGWIASLRSRAPADPNAAAAKAHECIDKLPVAAVLFADDGTRIAANSSADKLFAQLHLTAEQMIPAELMERVRHCAHSRKETEACDFAIGDLWLSWRLAPVATGGVLGLPADITLQKNQEVLVARERDTALHAARMTSEFVATLSHDIRVPMNGVLGMANLLREAGLTPQQQELTRSVIDSAESVITLTDELLDLAKIEAGKLEINPQPVLLGQLIDELLRGQAARAAEKGLDLYCDLDALLPAEIHVDPVRLRQILANLLSNALKFTDRGEVFVRVWCEPSAQDPRVGEMRFSVRDTGIGIPQEKRDHLFKAFSQADASTYSLYGGTGLGLSTSHRLADLMGGRMWFDSEAGHGSTFHLALPYHPVEGSNPPVWTERHVQIDGRDILVIEDNPHLSALIRNWITRWGGRAKLVDNAGDIISWIEAGGRCAVAIIDLDLPHSNGIAALRTLAQRSPTTRQIVFAARPPDAKLGLAHCDIVLKPASPDAFLECLRRPPRPAPKPAAQPTAPSDQPTATNAAAVPSPAPSPKPPKARVIVADDDLVNQKVMRTYLERLGCEVRLAANGVEALTVLAANPCDVLFLDIMMPRMDGMQTVREIRRHEADDQAAGKTVRRLPIVAITAKVMPGDREAGLAAGFDDYATKPINDTRLRESLQKFIPSFQPPGPLASGAPLLAAQQALLVDRERLNELGSGDPDTMREIVALFFERMQTLFPELEQALAAGNMDEARRHAHTGAGSCATCGMVQAQNVMRRMERSIEAGQTDHTHELITETRRILGATRAALADLLPP